MVPEGWNIEPLAQLLEKIIDYRGQSVPKSSSGIPLITARNVREGYLDFSNQEYVDESKYKEWMNRGTPQKGDILFTTEAPLGKVCRYPSKGTFAVGQRTVTLRTNKKLDSEFLLYTILSERGQLLIDLRSSGSTAKGIKSSELKKVKITYPDSLQEQRKIAAILSTWDKAITTTEQLLANSQQQKKALMQQLLTGKKRLLDENGERFRGEWESQHLKKILQISKGSQLNRDTLSKYDLYPVINGGIEPSGYTSEYNSEANTITISEGGNSCGFVGFQSVRFWCGGHCYAIKNLKIDLKFAYQLLKFNQTKIMRLRVGSGLPNIQKKDLEALSVVYPASKDEQQKIADLLTAADKGISALQQKIEALKQEKKALMQQLLTGKRRVKVDEVAA